MKDELKTDLKRHQSVKLLADANPEYVEYHNEHEEDLEEELVDKKDLPKIKKGMKGRINLILPNGKYHIEVFDSKGKTIAYAQFDHENLELLD